MFPPLPDVLEYDGTRFRKSVYECSIEYLDYVGEFDGYDLYKNPRAHPGGSRSIFVLKDLGEVVQFDEIFPEPSASLSEEALEVCALLRAAPLFSNLGATPPSEYLSIGSWALAARSCDSRKRDGLFIPISNNIGEDGSLIARRAGRDWVACCWQAGEIQRALLQPYHALFRSSDPSAKRYSDGLGAVYDAVENDFAMIVREAEISPFVPALFFRRYILPIYLAGHIPIRWSGKSLETAWLRHRSLPPGHFVVL